MAITQINKDIEDEVKDVPNEEKEGMVKFTPEMQDDFHAELGKIMGLTVSNGLIQIMSNITSNIVNVPLTNAIDKKRYIDDTSNLVVYLSIAAKVFGISNEEIAESTAKIYENLIKQVQEIAKAQEEERTKETDDEESDVETSTEEVVEATEEVLSSGDDCSPE